MNARLRSVLAARRDTGIGPARTGEHAEREGGQIIVLFALSIVVMLVFAAIVVDLGVLRNNKVILTNAVDSAALAGGTVMPVDGAGTNNSAAAVATNALVVNTLLANYPSLAGSQYTVTYRCLIGIDKSSPVKPNVTRDIPTVCDPQYSLGWGGGTTLAQKQAFFTGAGDTRSSACNPFVGDKCNTVVVSANSTTNYSFGRVVGVNNGNTGAIQSAACNGPCGQPPSIPVDLVMIIDRTGSMQTGADPSGTSVTSGAAKAVLGVYDPTLQRVALGLLGPSKQSTTCSGGGGGPAVSVDVATSFGPTAPTRAADTSNTNAAGATSLGITKPSGVGTGSFLIAGITVAGGVKIGAGAGVTVTPPAGWTLIKATTNATNVGMQTYYRVAGNAEPNTYTWNFSSSVQASGGIIRMSGVDTADPIDVSQGATGNDVTNPFRVIAPSVTTTTDETGLVGFYGIASSATFTNNNFTEQFDVRNANSGASTATEGATDTQATAGTTSATTNYATASVGGQWVAQLVALNPAPGYETYGTNPATDLAKWIPVGFTGTDGDSPAPQYNEAYSDGLGNLNTATHIVSAINCFDSNGFTNLATPLAMASYYLQNYGRPNVKWGIILETDGEPHYGGYGNSADYTCAQTSANATAAKAIKNANGDPIEIFTVGFFYNAANPPTCPDNSGTWQNKKVTNVLANVATSSVDNGCTAAENTDGDHFYCGPKDSDLAAIFSTVASQLSGIRTHLVSLYPLPIVQTLGSSIGTHNGGQPLVVNGKYFTGATSVRMGGVAVPFTVNSDIKITISSTAPGATGASVDIVVTTGGGSSPIVNGDRYTYN